MKCPYCDSPKTKTLTKIGDNVLKFPMGLCLDCDSTWVIGGRRHKRTRQRGGKG